MSRRGLQQRKKLTDCTQYYLWKQNIDKHLDKEILGVDVQSILKLCELQNCMKQLQVDDIQMVYFEQEKQRILSHIREHNTDITKSVLSLTKKSNENIVFDNDVNRQLYLAGEQAKTEAAAVEDKRIRAL